MLYMLVFLQLSGTPTYVAAFSNSHACEVARIGIVALAMTKDIRAAGARIDHYICINTSTGSVK